MNKQDLKSFVRFDGDGRIVPGSIILARKKPKVGKWYEGPAYLCCNPTTSTTSSTTTIAPTTTTTTTVRATTTTTTTVSPTTTTTTTHV